MNAIRGSQFAGGTRRDFLSAAAAAGLGLCVRPSWSADPAARRPARIAITLDLEMSAQYPRRDLTEWNYEKGNLDEATKQYAVQAADLVRERGGVIHFFCVGRVLEQPDVGWLKHIAETGHPIGNHTYDHVNVKARRPEDTQFRFQRAPWLVEGLTAAEIIERNVRLTERALQQRLGLASQGFRTPGGFHDGLADRPDVQQLLREIGFTWVSSKYPAHQTTRMGEPPSPEVFASIVESQAAAQPFVYPGGLIEIPMSPISDVTAFRSGRWKLDAFLEALRRAVAWTIERGAVFDFLAHPSCLVVEDPDFASLKLLCDLVRQAGDRARLVSLTDIAQSL